MYDDWGKKVFHYRIDRMDNVKMLEEDITEGIEAGDFDLPGRKRQLFSMFGGETVKVEMRADKGLIDVIHDKFGDLAHLRNMNNGVVGFSVDVQVSPTFLAWCCSFGKQLKVVSPAAVVEQVKTYIDELKNTYDEM